MININSPVSRIIRNKYDEYVFFSGTSYLGISANNQFHKLVYRGMKLYGSNYPTSRNSNIRQPVYNEFESYLSDFTGTESAISLSSGFLAGRLIAYYLGNKRNVYFAPRLHPALWINDKSFLEEDFNTWSQHFIKEVNNSDMKNVILVSNSLDSLLGKIYDFTFLLDIRKDINVQVILDDSHGLGIIGNAGKGIMWFLPKSANINYLIVSSLAKAFGVQGGIILGESEIIDSLKKFVFFSASSAISPAYIYAFLNAKKLYDLCREKLFDNVNKFIDLIGDTDFFRFDSRFPVFYSPENAIYELCKKYGIILSSFPYPRSCDENITRIVISAAHTHKDITGLYNVIKFYFDKFL
jgi:7-keto-8-aminopelargonate synthetase-like enzyme